MKKSFPECSGLGIECLFYGQQTMLFSLPNGLEHPLTLMELQNIKGENVL